MHAYDVHAPGSVPIHVAVLGPAVKVIGTEYSWEQEAADVQLIAVGS